MEEKYYILVEQIVYPEDISSVRVLLLTNHRDKAVQAMNEVMEEDEYGSFGEETEWEDENTAAGWGDVGIRLLISEQQIEE